MRELSKRIEPCPKRDGNLCHCYHDVSVNPHRKEERCCFCNESLVFARDPNTGALSPRDEHGNWLP